MTDKWAAVAAMFAPRSRRWATPGALAQELDPSTVQTPALDLIDRELVNLADGDVDRLAVFMPPQEGKSVRTSQRFVEWLLTDNPELRIAIVSYSDEMARRWGSDIKLDAATFDGSDGALDLGIKLRADSKAAGRWQIDGHAGGVYCVGIAGSLTGKPVDILVIDDPVKDLEEAQSLAYQERAKRFWQAVAVPRLGPGAKVVLIQTRFHELDLAGQILAEDAGRWRVVSIPAIADSPDDPLGRPEGEPLLSARGHRDWAAIRREVGDFVWASLYQQHPAPLAGGLFRRDQFKYWSGMPSDEGRARIDLDGRAVYLENCWIFAVCDLAASVRTQADYSVFATWAFSLDRDLILLDLHRERMQVEDHLGAVRPMMSRWGATALYVEEMFHSATLVRDATQAGIPVLPLHADTDKVTRALSATPFVGAGKLWLAAGAPWVSAYLDEVTAFPNSAKDDQVDVTAYAARLVSAHYIQPTNASDYRRPRIDPDDPFEKGFSAAVGDGYRSFFDIPY